MENNENLICDTKRKMLAKYPRFGSEIAKANIEFRDDLPTAATDGKNIYVNPNYFKSLNENDRLFMIAHEVMHIKFMHVFRLQDKNGTKKDLKLWNIATDAIINANLERDGFKIKEGYVNMPEALNYSAEEFYQKLLEEKEKQEQEKKNNQNQKQENGQGQEQNNQQGSGEEQSQDKQQGDDKGQNQDNNEQGNSKGQGQANEQEGSEGQDNEQGNNEGQKQDGEQGQNQNNGQESSQSQGQNGEEGTEKNQSQDSNCENSKQSGNQTSNVGNSQGSDHSLWEEAFKEHQNSKKGKNQKKDKEQENSEEQDKDSEQRRKQKQNKNQQNQSQEQEDSDSYERNEFEENRKEKRESFKKSREMTQKNIINKNNDSMGFGNIGKSKQEIDWKLLIRREVEKNETIWTQRRSIAENNYAFRLEENEIEDDSETEVMIDVSGSVDLDLVRAFLRQLKPLLKQSKLKVGCFNTRVYDFKEVKKIADIDKLWFPMGGGTDLDIPVRAFTKKREINKIIFTDGYPGIMPREDLKRENVIWLVYGNRDFHPCCGKVINITEKQLQKLHQIKDSSKDEMSR